MLLQLDSLVKYESKGLFLHSKYKVMHFQIINPTGELAQFVKYYWVMEKSPLEGDVCERVIPTGNIELMFHYKNTFNAKRSDNTTYKQDNAFLSGISNSYADVTTSGETGMICVTFHPFGACNFFNFPLLEIENLNISLDCILGSKTRDVYDQLCEANSITEKVAVIEQFLQSNQRETIKSDALLIKSGLELINKSKGQINSITLSEKLSVTSKNLERKFSALVGKTPKQFIKIVRFQNILNSYSSADGRSFTQLAYENGYFDQAHFIKDFKTFSGLTPKEYFANYHCLSDYYY